MKYLKIYELTEKASEYLRENSDEKDKLLQNTLKEYEQLKCAQRGLQIDITEDFVIEKDEHGKPYVADKGSKSIKFSISHSGGYWGCVVSDKDVGLDIQVVRDDVDIAGISKRFFTEEECAFVNNADSFETALNRFFDIWVRKEAYIKLTGLGLSQGLRNFAVADSEVLFKSVNDDRGYFFTDLDKYAAFDRDDEPVLVKGVVCSETGTEIIINKILFDIAG